MHIERESNDHFLWPGFGENLRVLRWIIDRCEGRVEADALPIGFLPKPETIDISGLDISSDTLKQLLNVDQEQWRDEMVQIGEYLESYGERLPEQLKTEHQNIVDALT